MDLSPYVSPKAEPLSGSGEPVRHQEWSASSGGRVEGDHEECSSPGGCCKIPGKCCVRQCWGNVKEEVLGGG